MASITADSKSIVSVLMLTYNRGWCLGEAISSVLNQTYQNFELIIIDDGSSDNTEEIVASFSDPRIKYFKHQENLGLKKSRQESLTLATGTYIAVLDSDDLWCSPDKLAKQVEYLENNPAVVMVGTNIIKIDNLGNEIGKSNYTLDNDTIRRNILVRNQFAHSSVLIRKSVIAKTAGYDNFPVAEDLAFFLNLGQFGNFANLPTYDTKYRIHGVSESRDKVKMLENILEIIKQYRKSYQNYYLALFLRTVQLKLVKLDLL